MAEPLRTSSVQSKGWTTCVVAATGPSLSLGVVDACRGHHVIAVNDAYRVMPWAEVLYAGDRDWWELHEGCPDFAGEKWSAHEPTLNNKSAIAERYGLQLVAGPRRIDAPGFCLHPQRIHYGNCSGFQAINLGLHFGATTIYLVGFDMRVVEGRRHFFGDHPVPSMNLAKYEHFLGAFNEAARMLPPEIRIVNCTPGSALRCFSMGELEHACAPGGV